MKKVLAVLLLLPLSPAYGQNQKAQTLKSILLEQLRTTHNQKDWFVPVDVALEGLTPEQAKWKDKSGNHSIGELVTHLTFWNQQALAKFKGEKPATYDGKNDETFNNDFDSGSWSATVQKLDNVLMAWEKAVEDVNDDKLKSSASVISHIGTHNAYHIGQIVYIRRLQGSWDPAKGVK
jgi:uncharacterized damage-inducible protein DinB